MLRQLLAAAVVAALLAPLWGSQATAGTIAYWRFEEGPAGANIARGGEADGVYYPAVADDSGNGYELSTWSDGGGAGYAYNSNVAGVSVSGDANNFSVKNTGGYPAMWTGTGDGIQTISPAAFTVEATFKLENGGYRTIIGRDSQGTATTNGDLAALYFQAAPKQRHGDQVLRRVGVLARSCLGREHLYQLRLSDGSEWRPGSMVQHGGHQRWINSVVVFARNRCRQLEADCPDRHDPERQPRYGAYSRSGRWRRLGRR